MKNQRAENKLSLNLEKRRAEIEQDKARKEARVAARAKIPPADEKRYTVTLDNASKPELQLAVVEKKANDKATEKASAPTSVDGKEVAAAPTVPVDGDEDDEDAEGAKTAVDAVRHEAMNVLTDLVEFTRNLKATTAAAAVK